MDNVHRTAISVSTTTLVAVLVFGELVNRQKKSETWHIHGLNSLKPEHGWVRGKMGEDVPDYQRFPLVCNMGDGLYLAITGNDLTAHQTDPALYRGWRKIKK